MTPNDYQTFTATTAAYPECNALHYIITGLAAEAGEVAGKYAKYLRGDNVGFWDEVADSIDKEMGDVLWFVSQWCNETGTTLEELMEANMVKLSARKLRGTICGEGDDR